MSAILFYLFAVVAVATALGMIFGRNAVHGVLLMVVNFSMVAMLYLMLDAPFLAAVQILVYAGAIMVLFLFVIMLMGNDPGPLWEHIPLQRPLALLFVLALIIGLVPIVSITNVTGGQWRAPAGALSGDPRLLAEALFTQYVLPFEVTSLILLVAMIGAIVLGLRHVNRTKQEQAAPLEDGR